jgi:hypothetical protein
MHEADALAIDAPLLSGPLDFLAGDRDNPPRPRSRRW